MMPLILDLEAVLKNTRCLKAVRIKIFLLSTQWLVGLNGKGLSPLIGTVYSDWLWTIDLITRIMPDWEIEHWLYLPTNRTTTTIPHTHTQIWLPVEMPTSSKIFKTTAQLYHGISFTLDTAESREKQLVSCSWESELRRLSTLESITTRHRNSSLLWGTQDIPTSVDRLQPSM